MKFIYLIFFISLTLALLPFFSNKAFAAGDGKAPVTSYSPSGTVGLDTSWYKSNVTVTLTCTDTGSPASGCKETYYCIETNTNTACNPLLASGGGITSTTNPTVFTVSQDGNHKIRWRSKDNSGLLEAESNKSFKIDKTAPTTTGYKAQWHSDDTGSWKDYVPPFDPNEWYSKDEIPKDDNIYFSYTCTDPDNTGKGNISGCKETLACFSSDGACTPGSTGGRLSINQDGNFIVRYQSRDNAGNDEAIRTYGAKRDITPPTYQYKITNFNQNLSKTITITCQDSTSGCSQIKYCTSTTFSSCTPTTVYTTPAIVPSTAQSFSLSVTDIAGNSTTHDQKLYIVSGQDTCQVRVYKDNGSGSVVAANRQYVSSGQGNSDFTLNAGQSYYVENTISSGFWDNGASSHTHKIWELDPSKTNKDGNNFYFFNTTDNVGEDDGNGLTTLHGTWNPVTGSDIGDNLLQDPDQSVYNSKTGPWRWKFTPQVIGETTFDVFFGNRNSYDQGGVTYKRCHRTTNIVSIINAPPGPFSITSVTPNNCSVSQIPSITINWSQSEGADSYEIWRSDQSLPIATNIPANQLTYTDTNVVVGTNYSYLVYAKKNSGGQQTSSGWSSQAAPPNCTPPPAVDLKIVIGLNEYDNPPTQQTGTAASLQWTTTNSPTSCTATSNPVNALWSGSVGTLATNSQPIGTLLFTPPPPSIKQFSIVCSNAGGASPVDNVEVKVNPAQTPPVIQTTGGDIHSNESITP